MYEVLLIVHTLLALAIVLVVLLQRSDNDGFGLSGGGNAMMSTRAKANFLTRTTALLATAFMATSLILAIMVTRGNESSILDAEPVAVGTEAEGDDAAPAVPALDEDAPEPAEPATPSVPFAE